MSSVFLLAAWAKVEVTMDDSVEVYLGDPAHISCQYSFTDVDAEPSNVITQWFVVSTAGPAAKADTARLVRSKTPRLRRLRSSISCSVVHASQRGKQTHSSCQNANKPFTAWSRFRTDTFMD